MSTLSAEARNLSWLLSTFATNTSGVTHAMVVSADGLPIAISAGLDRALADQLAAVASGLVSLSLGAARSFAGGRLKQTVVEMDQGFLLVMAISDGSCLTVLAAAWCDMGLAGYEMALLAARFGDASPPACAPSCKPPCHHDHPTSLRCRAGRSRRGPAPAAVPITTPCCWISHRHHHCPAVGGQVRQWVRHNPARSGQPGLVLAVVDGDRHRPPVPSPSSRTGPAWAATASWTGRLAQRPACAAQVAGAVDRVAAGVIACPPRTRPGARNLRLRAGIFGPA